MKKGGVRLKYTECKQFGHNKMTYLRRMTATLRCEDMSVVVTPFVNEEFIALASELGLDSVHLHIDVSLYF